MARTLLDLVKEFTKRTGIKVPNAVASSTDPQLMQIVALLHEEIEALTEGPALQAMVKEFTFSATAAEDQGFVETLCGEPFRYILNDILWNRTTKLPILGPLAPQDWQTQKAYGITGPTTQYRIRGEKLLFLPSPTAGDTIAGEFVRMYGIIPTGGTVPTKETFTADTDTCILPDRLLLAGLRWRWKKEKGLAHGAELAHYNMMKENYKLKTGTRKILDMGGDTSDTVKPGISVPAGNWSP